jgi:hypothetical protein
MWYTLLIRIQTLNEVRTLRVKKQSRAPCGSRLNNLQLLTDLITQKIMKQ